MVPHYTNFDGSIELLQIKTQRIRDRDVSDRKLVVMPPKQTTPGKTDGSAIDRCLPAHAVSVMATAGEVRGSVVDMPIPCCQLQHSHTHSATAVF